MKNPFRDFRPQNSPPSSEAAVSACQVAGGIRDALAQGYLEAVGREASHLAWMVEHSRVIEAYAAMLAFVDGLRFDVYDIEALVDLLAQEDGIPLMVPGVAGLYLSALVNRTAEKEITFHLESQRTAYHFLGYRLPVGRTLVLTGSVGDFAGAGLDGGTLIVRGTAGAWCGAGMLRGTIRVQGDAGHDAGQWMHGGEIHVSGQVRSIGRNRCGGRVSAKEVEIRQAKETSGARRSPGKKC